MAARKHRRAPAEPPPVENDASRLELKRLAIRLPESLKQRLLAQVDKDGYGERGVSEWIREALDGMLLHDPELEFVGQGDRRDGKHDDLLIITVPAPIAMLVHDRTLDMRERDLLIQGPKSVLLRSAIRFRLDRPTFPFAKPASSSARSVDTRRGG